MNNVAKLRFFLETTKEKGENLKQAAIFDDTRKNDICLPMVFETSGRQMFFYVYSSEEREDFSGGNRSNLSRNDVGEIGQHHHVGDAQLSSQLQIAQSLALGNLGVVLLEILELVHEKLSVE